MCGNALYCGNTTEIKALFCHNITALFCDNITALLCRKIRNNTKIIQIYITEKSQVNWLFYWLKGVITMTTAARMNLQRGIPEDRRFEHTTYTAESALDRLVLARVEARRLIIDKKNYDEMVAAAAEDIAKAAEKELDKLLKDFK